VRITDRAVDATLQRQPKAEPDNQNHVAAPMPGKISSVVVKKGEAVKAGDRLLSIEAMKMETAVYSPRDSKVADVLVKAGSTVEAKDLLVVLEA
jgi:pyruvate carboxylase